MTTTIYHAILSDIFHQLDWLEMHGVNLSPGIRWTMFHRMLNLRLT